MGRGLGSGLGIVIACAGILMGAVTVHAQGGLFGAIVNEAKRKAETAINRQPQQSPPSSPTPTSSASRSATPGSPYAAEPAFESFWPAPEPYVAPSQRSQVRTALPAGTPDSKGVGPMTSAGKPAWVWSEYELRTLSWGNELPTRGSAGAPEFVKLNINNTPVRQKWISTFDSWIRATYTPMGAVTAPFREIYPEKATNSHVPIRYGISETLYAPVVKDGKIYRSPSPPFGWINIMANQVPGDEAAWSFNVPGQNYAFTMVYDRDFRLTEPNDAARIAAEANAVRARIGIDAPVYILGRLVVVMLTRDNRLPVRQMTIGETLEIADAGIHRQQAKEPAPDAMYQRAPRNLQRMRTLHAGDLNAPAWMRGSQFTHQSFYDDEDLFGTGQYGNRYPLYTFDEAAYAGAKSDRPQWLAISFPRLTKGHGWGERMAFDAMVDHFNFAYARDAIFNPERVAGVPYQPRP